MIIIAIVLPFTFENDATDFLVGFFGGGGLGFYLQLILAQKTSSIAFYITRSLVLLVYN